MQDATANKLDELLKMGVRAIITSDDFDASKYLKQIAMAVKSDKKYAECAINLVMMVCKEDF